MSESNSTKSNQVCFGHFEFDLESRELTKHGRVIKLQAQPATVLALLLNRAGECVTRQEIQQHVWGDNFVEFDQGLNYCISQIRAALGDKAETPVFIETIPKRGYRFSAPVTQSFKSANQPTKGVEVSRSSRPRVFVLAALVVIAVGTLSLAAFLRVPTKRIPQAKIMLAVLPFENLNADPEREYFSEGLTDELVTTLSQLNPQQLGVIARSSTLKYKEDKTTVDQIGRELGVEYLLDGSVRSEGDRARMSVRLVRVSDQSHVWAENYERPLSKMLDAQREVAQAVANNLSLELLASDQSDRKRSTTKSEVHDAYLKARYLLGKKSPEDVEKAITLLQSALTIDPSYAPAHTCLAQAYLSQPGTFSERVARAKESLRTAESLDDSSARTHLLLGYVALFGEWDWDKARKHLEQAIALDQGSAYSYHAYAAYLTTLGRHDEAIAQLQKAKELDPVSPAVLGDIGWIYYAAGRYQEAIKQSEEILELEPKEIFARECLLYSYLKLSKESEALTQAMQIMKLRGATNQEIEAIRRKSAAESLQQYWKWSLKWLNNSTANGARSHIDSCAVALIHADLGEKEKAFDYLEKAYSQRSELLVYLDIEPRYEPLRSDPRFEELLRRVMPSASVF